MDKNENLLKKLGIKIRRNEKKEFIVDGWKIDPYTRGDVSSVFEEWNSKVIHIIVYDYNYFD